MTIITGRSSKMEVADASAVGLFFFLTNSSLRALFLWGWICRHCSTGGFVTRWFYTVLLYLFCNAMWYTHAHALITCTTHTHTRTHIITITCAQVESHGVYCIYMRTFMHIYIVNHIRTYACTHARTHLPPSSHPYMHTSRYRWLNVIFIDCLVSK